VKKIMSRNETFAAAAASFTPVIPVLYPWNSRSWSEFVGSRMKFMNAYAASG
jgi:hypothetical protein